MIVDIDKEASEVYQEIVEKALAFFRDETIRRSRKAAEEIYRWQIDNGGYRNEVLTDEERYQAYTDIIAHNFSREA